MHKRWLIWLTVLLAGVLLLPANQAQAAASPPGDDGIIIWNEDYTLEQDKRLEGDLVVINGDATLEAGSRVVGSAIIWQGSAQVDGTVEKDLVVSGGDITLGGNAQVGGDVVCSWDCDLKQEEGARVGGRVIEGLPLPGINIKPWNGFVKPSVRSVPRLWASSGPGQILRWVLNVIRSVVGILVVAAVAGLVALIWPHPLAQVGKTAVEAPWPSLAIGLLTILAAVVLIIVLAVTVCLSPLAILLALALSAAGLFGWAAVGARVGERLLHALNAHQATPLWIAGLGTLLISLIGMGLSVAFCLAPLGWLGVLVLGCIGLGAVVLTRFGTMAYTPSPPTPPVPPSPPAAPVPGEAPQSPEDEA
jgi:hypothetical protein